MNDAKLKRPVFEPVRKRGGQVKNQIGRRSGRLLVIARRPDNERGLPVWKCLCDCGNEKDVSARNLNNGTQSCGCLMAEKFSSGKSRLRHGLSDTPEHIIWRAMKARCYYEKHIGYARYGGRGIVVCDRWRESFENFLADMGNRPTSKHSIDRVDSNGNYEPSNCKWATRQEQNNNRNNNALVTYRGERMSVAEVCRRSETQHKYHVIASRIRDGWDVERALATPLIQKPTRGVQP